VTVAQTETRKARPPAAVAGFEAISRYWDNVHGTFAAKILPGEYYVTTTDEMITTTLGSCVAACVRDPRINVGGMNHFLLPVRGSTREVHPDDPFSLETRYGAHAMESLINSLLSLGARRDRLEVKLFGGGSVIPGMTSNVGEQNSTFAEEYIQREGLQLVASDTGGPWPRKVQYFPVSGRARSKKLYRVDNRVVEQRENQLAERIRDQGAGGEVDLF
jgi:chemotaxis protein CheD